MNGYRTLLKNQSVWKNLGSGTGTLHEGSNGFRGRSAFGKPCVHFVECDVNSAFSCTWVVGAKNFEETALTAKTLVGSDNAIKRAIFGAFPAETKCYGHDKSSVDGLGVLRGGEFASSRPEIKRQFACLELPKSGRIDTQKQKSLKLEALVHLGLPIWT